ncbi:DUF5752 family protein [Chloroflexota bacterium]
MAKIIKITKNEASRRLGYVPEDKLFWCQDGRVIKNLAELEQALSDMSEETFFYHSGEERNDFCNWVKDVVGDNKLATDLSKAKSPSQAQKAVVTRISFLQQKL